MFLFSCQLMENKQSSTNNDEQETVFRDTTIKVLEVKTIKITRKNFSQRSLTTGILKADQQAVIKFRASGQIEALPIQEGQFIKKGDLLCRQEQQSLQLELQQAVNGLDDALFKKKDLLVRSGGEAGVDSSVSAEVLKNIHIQSGYNKAQQAIKQIEYQINQTSLYAPFSGIVADLEPKQFQEVVAGEKFCRLINANTFEAEFTLLENEASGVKIGQLLNITPIAKPDKTIKARVRVINPVVSEEGLITFRAKLQGNVKGLFEGMNVRISIERIIPNQLVIPKEALVLRSGRQVVFIYENGLAKWNYVTVAYENDKVLSISEGLKEGDQVIYEGNMNLAHDSEVVLK